MRQRLLDRGVPGFVIDAVGARLGRDSGITVRTEGGHGVNPVTEAVTGLTRQGLEAARVPEGIARPASELAGGITGGVADAFTLGALSGAAGDNTDFTDPAFLAEAGTASLNASLAKAGGKLPFKDALARRFGLVLPERAANIAAGATEGAAINSVFAGAMQAGQGEFDPKALAVQAGVGAVLGGVTNVGKPRDVRANITEAEARTLPTWPDAQQVVAEAAREKPRFLADLQAIEAGSDGRLTLAPGTEEHLVKGAVRIADKLAQGRAITDALRATYIADDPTALGPLVVHGFEGKGYQATLEDRWTNRAYGEYGDVTLKLRGPDGNLVKEVQLMPQWMSDAKVQGHYFYELRRDAEARGDTVQAALYREQEEQVYRQAEDQAREAGVFIQPSSRSSSNSGSELREWSSASEIPLRSTYEPVDTNTRIRSEDLGLSGDARYSSSDLPETASQPNRASRNSSADNPSSSGDIGGSPGSSVAPLANDWRPLPPETPLAKIPRIKDAADLVAAYGAVEGHSPRNPGLYVRWSDSVKDDVARGERSQRVLGSGTYEKGLSAIEFLPRLGEDLTSEELAKAFREYSRIAAGKHGWLLTGDEVGRGADGEPLLRNVQVVARIDPPMVNAMHAAQHDESYWRRVAEYRAQGSGNSAEEEFAAIMARRMQADRLLAKRGLNPTSMRSFAGSGTARPPLDWKTAVAQAVARGVGGAAYGAWNNPDDRLKGAVEGGIAGALPLGAPRVQTALRMAAHQVPAKGTDLAEQALKDRAETFRSPHGSRYEVGVQGPLADIPAPEGKGARVQKVAAAANPAADTNPRVVVANRARGSATSLRSGCWWRSAA